MKRAQRMAPRPRRRSPRRRSRASRACCRKPGRSGSRPAEVRSTGRLLRMPMERAAPGQGADRARRRLSLINALEAQAACVLFVAPASAFAADRFREQRARRQPMTGGALAKPWQTPRCERGVRRWKQRRSKFTPLASVRGLEALVEEVVVTHCISGSTLLSKKWLAPWITVWSILMPFWVLSFSIRPLDLLVPAPPRPCRHG